MENPELDLTFMNTREALLRTLGMTKQVTLSSLAGWASALKYYHDLNVIDEQSLAHFENQKNYFLGKLSALSVWLDTSSTLNIWIGEKLMAYCTEFESFQDESRQFIVNLMPLVEAKHAEWIEQQAKKKTQNKSNFSKLVAKFFR